MDDGIDFWDLVGGVGQLAVQVAAAPVVYGLDAVGWVAGQVEDGASAASDFVQGTAVDVGQLIAPDEPLPFIGPLLPFGPQPQSSTSGVDFTPLLLVGAAVFLLWRYQ